MGVPVLGLDDYGNASTMPAAISIHDDINMFCMRKIQEWFDARYQEDAAHASGLVGGAWGTGMFVVLVGLGADDSWWE